jgi:hypothetical protein
VGNLHQVIQLRAFAARITVDPIVALSIVVLAAHFNVIFNNNVAYLCYFTVGTVGIWCKAETIAANYSARMYEQHRCLLHSQSTLVTPGNKVTLLPNFTLSAI